MSPSAIASDSPIETAPRASSAPTRPFYWSVRREIWENHAIYIAPLAIAGVVLLGMVVGAANLPHKFVAALGTIPAVKQAQALSLPIGFAAFAISVTAFIVAVFYCLGALQGERRDRTILFWKSLPVSDLTTVMAKASVPLVILPVVTFLVSLGTLLILVVTGAIVLPLNGLPASLMVTAFPLPQTVLDLAYTMVAAALWHAPIWGWLLLVSGWAKRAPFLWAFGPPLALSIFERLAFNTSYVWQLMTYRVTGVFSEAFSTDKDPRALSQMAAHGIDPVKFLMTPGLSIGLVVAALLLAAAVWQRRYRAPI